MKNKFVFLSFLIFEKLFEDLIFQMSDPDIAQTIRAMFIIDPSHRLRLSMLYPVSTGRSIRLVLQNNLRIENNRFYINFFFGIFEQ